MVALQIRDVPDGVRQTLADSASRRGQSLQSYLLKLVTDEASRTTNVTMLSHFANRTDGSSLSDTDLALVIEQARSERGSDATNRPT